MMETGMRLATAISVPTGSSAGYLLCRGGDEEWMVLI
jgi:hypothetical protein